MRAKHLQVSISKMSHGFSVHYKIDAQEVRSFSFEFPYKIHISDSTLHLIGALESVFLGQLCLADVIQLEFPLSEEILQLIKPVADSVYKVRCFRDELEFHAPHFIISTSKKPNVTLASDAEPLERTRNVGILWSGGKDSTLAVMLLIQNGYRPFPIHINANIDTFEIEKSAVENLSNKLDIQPQYVILDFPDLLLLLKSYSKVKALPPFHNSVPHGRELLLLGAALVLASEFNMDYICFGLEKNMWIEQITFQGERIERWETGSETAFLALNTLIEQYSDKSVRLFSPVAPLSDFRVFATMAKSHPEFIAKMSSCLFGAWCGECIKCLRYDLYQKALGVDLIPFLKYPDMENNQILKALISSWDNHDQPYWSDIHFALSTIVRKEKQLAPLLQHYKEAILPRLGDLNSIEKDVNDLYEAKLLPDGWRIFT